MAPTADNPFPQGSCVSVPTKAWLELLTPSLPFFHDVFQESHLPKKVKAALPKLQEDGWG